ncbi:ATP-binding protein [Alicyclobacillus curvatus]|nr:ATP-binding protein [Alicyclobacillus curvatus]WDL99607.1 ATP-binding protein [Alicyclobacillus sp. ALC3]
MRKGGHGLEPWLPLAPEHVSNMDDPLSGILTTIGSDHHSRWVFEVWMKPLRDARFRRTLLQKSRVSGERKRSEYFSPAEILAGVFGKQAPPNSPMQTLGERDHEHKQSIRSRLAPNQRPFQVSVRLFADGSTVARAHLPAVLAAMGQLRKQGWLTPIHISKRRLAKAIERGTPTRPMWWTSGELCSLVHLPDSGQPCFRHVVATTGLILPPPASSRDGIRLGWSNFPGSEDEEIRIPLNQAAKHTFLAGATGSGKTTALLQIMLGLIDEMQKRPDTASGFTFFDPHGGAVERLLAHIPPSLHEKVHVIPLGPTDYPRGLNLFRMDHQTDAEAITGEFINTLQELWPGSRPRSEHYLRNNVLSLLQNPPQTVLGISYLFANERFRKKLLPKLPPHLQQFWTGEFAEIRNIADHLGPIWNKLGALTTYPSLRRILGQTKSAIDTRTVMDEGHIVLIDGSGCTADAVKIIAGLYLIDLHFTCKRRPEHRSRLHVFFGDESHLYAVNVLQKILAEDRKFGLSLFLATQYLDQLPDPVLAGILGNVGTLMLLQLGGPDADRLTRWLKPDVTSRELMTLPELNALVRAKLDGGVTELFTLKNPLAQSGHPDWARQILERSDRVDGRLAEDVDREIEAMYGGSPAVSKPGQVKVGRASFQEDPFDYRI